MVEETKGYQADYKSEIENQKTKLRKTNRLIKTLFEYFDPGIITPGGAELLGDLIFEQRTIRHRIDSFTKHQEKRR